MAFTTTSTFPFGTFVGMTRSLTGVAVRTGGAPSHDATTARATSAATSRTTLRLFGAGAEEHLLQVREGRTEAADEEDPDDEASQARDEADHDVDSP